MMYSFGYSCDCLSSPQLSSPLKNWLGMDKRATRTCLPVKTNSCNIGTDTKPLNFIFRHVATVIETLGQNRVKMKRSNILILMSKKYLLTFSGCDFIWATLLGINPLGVNNCVNCCIPDPVSSRQILLWWWQLCESACMHIYSFWNHLKLCSRRVLIFKGNIFSL